VAPASPRRQLESSAVAAFMPVFALAPVWLLAMLVFWWPIQLVWSVPFWLFAGVYLAGVVLLFARPVQRVVFIRLLGARRPHPSEVGALLPAWRTVARANGVPPNRYMLAVLDADELNAFACGGHLVVVSSYALKHLDEVELEGVLAHELSHHLGLHTVALTIAQWMSVPILILARVGFFLQNVARAATDAFASHSAALTVLGRFIGVLLTAVGWLFLAGVLGAHLLGNWVGRASEFQADRRAVEMGFGRQLSSALREVVAAGGQRQRGWRARVFATHPPARTRVARIDAMLRARRAAGERRRAPGERRPGRPFV
jgi:Zn-dependent protease with chaperone function